MRNEEFELNAGVWPSSIGWLVWSLVDDILKSESRVSKVLDAKV